jgi:hypothetical protein
MAFMIPVGYHKSSKQPLAHLVACSMLPRLALRVAGSLLWQVAHPMVKPAYWPITEE